MAALHKARNPDLWSPQRARRAGPGWAVDRAHPLARGLVGCWSPLWGMRNLAGPGGDLTDYGSPVAGGAGPTGPEALSTANGTGWTCTAVPAALQPTAAWSALWRGTIAGSNAGSNVPLLGCYVDVFNNSPYCCWGLWRWSTGADVVALPSNNGAFQVYTVGGVLATGAAVTLLGTAALGGAASLYGGVGGPLLAAAGGFPAGGIGYSGPVVMCGAALPAAGGATANAGMAVGALWDRALTAAEAAVACTDPFAFLTPGG